MKFYVDKKPKNCEECPFLHDDRWCLINWYEIYTPDKVKSFENGCPLQSLADYTKQVRKEVLEQVYKVFTNEDVWKELKDWWLGNGNCKELKKCLDAMIEEKSVENIAKKFGHYKNFYQQLDLIQGENV